MAVFPKRIVLKNSPDTTAAIIAAIQSGGTSEIEVGEVVVGTAAGSVQLFTRDSAGSIVAVGSGSSKCLVSASAPTVLPDGNPLEEGNMWFNSGSGTFSVYYSGAWVEVAGGGGGGGRAADELAAQVRGEG